MIRTVYTLTLAFLLFAFPVFLSAQPANEGATVPPGKIMITGQLVQQGNQAPLEFATISVYASKDSSLVNGGLTDVNGKFQLIVKPGKYYAVAQFIGYQDKMISDINATKDKKRIKLGAIPLREDAVALEEVEVVAEKSQMTFKLDRKVFNVGKDLTNAGATAADILDNVPSISVDVEGNVSLRGSQNVRILINGKPSGLVGVGDIEALRRMQGDIIERIELITNPSARYEAEGEAGIINIILKKDQEKGLNGSISANTGFPQNHGASYSLNYRQRNLNLFSNFGVSYRKAPGGGFNNQRFLDENGNLESARYTTRDQERGGWGGNIQLGADYYIDDYNTLTGSVLYRGGQDDNESILTYEDYDSNFNLLGTTVRTDNETEDEHNIETALTYRRTFDTKDREFVFDFRLIEDQDTERSDFLEEGFLQENPLVQRSVITENERNILFQSDYVHPVGENTRFEGGLRAALRTIENAYELEEQGANGEFSVVPQFDDELEYIENVYAAYVIAGTEIGPIGLQGGLRAEYSDISASLLESNVRNDQNYLSFFPSASLTYKLTDQNQLQASYSRRISRPYFRLLLPFSNFGDRLNLWSGNPNLTPEFTDSYELGYLFYLPKGSILLGGFYRYTTDVIERVTLPQADGTTLRRPINLSDRDAYGLEMNISYDFFDWWSANSDLNFFRAITNGSFEGVDYSADTYIWTGRINTKLDFGERFDMQLSYNYRGPRQTTQGRRESVQSLNIGMSLEILSGRGTLTLSARDVFNTRIRRSTIDLPQLQGESEFQWRRSQGVVLGFTYRLNQKKKDWGRKEKRGGFEDSRSSGDDY
ncbi:MAG: TonB-dependent receptor [Saprospiraceae bacterium]|nr:TonB-dependent receptor [Saprospiraceae bacterium]